MCGIAGFIDSTGRFDRTDLIEMTDHLSHRGPDSSGYFIEQISSGILGLGHRRLSIIDLTEKAHQPMHFKNLTLSYNGEFYNFREQRKMLENKGYTFESDSDTEVLLKGFHAEGYQFLNKVNGMFALAIFDHTKETLILARDRIGVKPLYWVNLPGIFLFASELKPLIILQPADREINRSSLNTFLFHGYIPSPDTIFKNVRKLEPGTWLSFSKGKVDISHFWSIQDAFEKKIHIGKMSETKALAELDAILRSAVGYRMISDVPIGCFLSGGVDSTTVAWYMQALSSRPIDTFTIGFHEKSHDEAPRAKKLAAAIGTNHHELYLGPVDAAKVIEQIPGIYDEPFADSSQIPTFLVSRFASEKVKVCLSGDGGDELFCGYSVYSDLISNRKWMPFSKGLKLLDKALPMGEILDRIDRRLLKFLWMFDQESLINFQAYYSSLHLRGIVRNSGVELHPKFVDILKLSQNLQEANMLQHMTTYLPDLICTKVDRASMANGLEAREPLLDYRLFEFSFALPHSLKYNNGILKYILKKLLSSKLPPDLVESPKRGFALPIHDWLHNELSFLVKEYLSPSQFVSDDLLDGSKVKALLARFNRAPNDPYFSRLIWHIIVFQMWRRHYKIS